MEAADIIDTIDVGVIKGTYYYANSHGDDDWHPCAAATAAAYAKKVLYSIGADETQNPQPSMKEGKEVEL